MNFASHIYLTKAQIKVVRKVLKENEGYEFSLLVPKQKKDDLYYCEIEWNYLPDIFFLGVIVGERDMINRVVNDLKAY